MLVLEFANGGNLRQHLKKKWQNSTFEISLNEIIQISKQITEGASNSGTPTEYANLYRKCWNALPKERPTILEILDILNSISKIETLLYIKNRKTSLIPALDITINEQPQFYKTMHTDDLAKTLIRTTSILKPRRPSNSSSKASVDSITKTSSATSKQKN
ncbi:23163_t:CDS:2 [Gigaspora rosea]|nr:23163_t:CDS:2 [Gigaspora rosea]